MKPTLNQKDKYINIQNGVATLTTYDQNGTNWSLSIKFITAPALNPKVS